MRQQTANNLTKNFTWFTNLFFFFLAVGISQIKIHALSKRSEFFVSGNEKIEE